MNATSNSALVKNLAQKHGFSFCGISEARFLEDEAPRLDAWLNKGYHGKMSYMENHIDKRLDPTKLVPCAKSVVSLIYNYYPEKELDNQNYKLAKYAYGTDYHFVVKDKLKSIIHELQNQLGQIEGRVFVDSAPILERVWAAESGLGWIGKNSLLLNKNMGSFFFLAELIIDLELEPDGPVKDYCGSCTRCIDACPTEAIVGPMVLDSNKCISYLTIELKDEIPENFKDDMEGWVFGCDICQDVCPWNRFSQPHAQPEFMPSESLAMDSQQWEELTQEVFSKVFKKSAVKRTKFAGLRRNIDFLKNMKPD